MGAQLISETVAYTESAVCRRKLLLHYFGETLTQENCGACDNCLHPKEKLDVKDSVKIVLDAVHALEERFGINYVVDVVLGASNPQIATYRPRQAEVLRRRAGDADGCQFLAKPHPPDDAGGLYPQGH